METMDYEKLSYGKSTYKRVQRLRRKGQRRGIEVPYLGYELHKPEKPRIAFWVVAIVSVVLFVGIFVGIVFVYNELVKTFPAFKDLGDVLNVLFAPETFMLSSGLSTIPALLIISAIILLLFMFLLPLCAVLYMYSFVRESFYMAKCSKEEFAKGNIIASRITRLCVTLAVATALVIVLFIYMPEAKVTIGLVFGGIVVVLGSYLALIVFEKAKCKKWFESLDEAQKLNYLEHDNGLRHVKRRLDSERRFWSNLGK